jgi:hypothetical protein
VAKRTTQSEKRDKEQDTYTGDIVIHIDEELDNDRIHGLERKIAAEYGVYSACMHEKKRHLTAVDFDATEVRPNRFVDSVRAQGCMRR